MRTDAMGNPCPSTLGDYRALVKALVGETSPAVEFLDKRIAESPLGEDEPVVVSDENMREILFPMIREGLAE